MVQMSRRQRDSSSEPIAIAGRAKRLRSLDEFDPPYWLGLFQAARDRRQRFCVLVMAVAVAGLVIGWFAVSL